MSYPGKVIEITLYGIYVINAGAALPIFVCLLFEH
jgi:hypothetical protein